MGKWTTGKGEKWSEKKKEGMKTITSISLVVEMYSVVAATVKYWGFFSLLTLQ